MAEAAKKAEEKGQGQPMPAAAVAAPPPEGQNVAQAGAAANDVQFHPILLSAHAAKSSGASRLSHLGLNFDLSSFLSFYPMLRLGGYTWEAGYSPLSRALSKAHKNGRALHKAGLPTSLSEKLVCAILGEKEEQGTLPAEREEEVAFGNIDSTSLPEEKSGTEIKDKGEVDPKYKKAINVAEAAMFTSLAALHTVDSYKQMNDNMKLAVATELGKDQKDVGFMDMRRSNNPLVVSAMDRLCWQSPMRVLAGFAFIPALWTGIFANSLVITAERTVFYRPLGYDILSKAVNDVQINSLGQESKAELVDNLVRVLQAARFDHRQASIPREQVEALRPTLELIADDVISKRFGITGMLYIMGGGVLVPEDPKQSRINYQHVRDLGVSGVMEEAKLIKADRKVPSTKIWDARLAEKERGEGNIAESARREELLRERRAILSRGPLHAVPGSGMDPDARYGGGVQVY